MDSHDFKCTDCVQSLVLMLCITSNIEENEIGGEGLKLQKHSQVDAQIGCITILLSCQESLLLFLQWGFLIFVCARLFS